MRRAWRRIAALAFGCLLAAGGCGERGREYEPPPGPPPSPPADPAAPKKAPAATIEPGAESPKALLERLAKAIRARDLDALKSCFPQNTDAEREWADGRSCMILAGLRELAWRRKAIAKFPDYPQVFGGTTPDPGLEQTEELPKLIEHWNPADEKGDEATVQMPPSTPGATKPHRLFRVGGRWYYRSWNYGDAKEMREGGAALRQRADETSAWLDRVERFLETSSTAKELREKFQESTGK
jgi:hypothetical protein